jgi:glycosyltransferase involved in cell wall biosynthesis
MHAPVDSSPCVARRTNLIYVGPLDFSDGLLTLADAFLAARNHDPRLYLLLVGDGEDREALADLLGDAASFIVVPDRPQLSELVTEADLLVCPNTGAQAAPTIVEAQEIGLPVLAVDGGEAAELIDNGRSGFVVPDDKTALADAIRWLSRRATLRERLATGGRIAAGARHTSGRERIMTA